METRARPWPRRSAWPSQRRPPNWAGPCSPHAWQYLAPRVTDNCGAPHSTPLVDGVLGNSKGPVTAWAVGKFMGYHRQQLNGRPVLRCQVVVGEAPLDIINKLKPFWYKTDCTHKWKLQVYNAVIIAQISYGMNTVHLTQAMLNRLDPSR